MTSFNAPVTAATAELSIAAAMGGIRLAPVQLDGTLRSGLSVAQHNDARLTGFAAAEAKRAALTVAPVEVEAVESDAAEFLDTTPVCDVVDTGTIFEVADESDIAEALEIRKDAEGIYWVVAMLAETGEFYWVDESNWEDYFGADVEMRFLSMIDKAEVASMLADEIGA